MDFSKLKLKEGRYWDAFLHEDQTVLGRVYFWYKDDATLDLLDAPQEAIIEFYDLAKKFRNVLTSLFQPDLFNYLVLNNNTRHLHIHLIPRYSKKIEKFGIVFEDKNFGGGYKRNPDFILDEKMLLQIKELITSHQQ